MMGDVLKIVVSSGAHAVANCPVTVSLPWSYSDCRDIALVEETTLKPLAAQVAKDGKNAAATFIVRSMKPGTTQTLIATRLSAQQTPDRVYVTNVKEEGRVDVCIDKKDFTSYHYADKWVRPFLHPVIGPDGTLVTRSWPLNEDVPGENHDHPHHKSIWVAHGDCNGVDNWSEEPNHGWQRHQSFSNLVSGPVFGRITAKNFWCNAKGKKQFEEVRDMFFYALPGGDRLFDINVTFKFTESNMRFGDTKEGGLVAVRVTSSMDADKGGLNRIENGFGGVNEAETWGKKAPWCDYSGTVGDKHVGIAIFDHEENPRFPTNWHVRNYGLMTANCFGWSHYRPDLKLKGDMDFKKGSTRQWRYRLFVHKGDAAKGHVGERYLDYAFPPQVKLG